MLRVALAIAVLLVSTTARAESTCKPGKGTPIFEVRWSSPPSPATITTRVFATGAWTRVETHVGRPASRKSGCIDATELDEIKTALKAAKWKKTKQEPCYGVHVDRMAIFVFGAKKHTHTNCGGYDVDEASNEIFERIKRRISDGFSPLIIPEGGGD